MDGSDGFESPQESTGKKGQSGSNQKRRSERAFVNGRPAFTHIGIRQFRVTPLGRNRLSDKLLSWLDRGARLGGIAGRTGRPCGQTGHKTGNSGEVGG